MVFVSLHQFDAKVAVYGHLLKGIIHGIILVYKYIIKHHTPSVLIYQDDVILDKVFGVVG